MKKLTAILLALTLLSLTACGDVLSKLKKDKGDSPGSVQAKEPDIPGVPSYSGNDEPFVEYDPTLQDPSPVEPEVSQAEPDPAPVSGGKEDNNKPSDTGVTASHTDVSLFSAGETFTMSARGASGVYASSFASKNPEIASVDELTGLVTAVSPGMTTITMHVECSAGQFDFECIVRCRWQAREPDLPGSSTEDGQGAAEQPGTPQESDPPAQNTSPSLSSFISTLSGKYEGMSGMMVLDQQLLDNYYPGLSGLANVEEVLIEESATSMANMAVGLVKLSDSATTEDILAVQSILQGRISTQANGGAFYPASCETWQNGVITSTSNCVGMFVYPDGAHSMASLFTDTFGN